MTLWLIDANQKHYRLIDRFSPAFYVAGQQEKIAALARALEQQRTAVTFRLTEKIDLWRNAPRQVLEISVLDPCRPHEYGPLGSQV